jgi:hypothetical protein
MRRTPCLSRFARRDCYQRPYGRGARFIKHKFILCNKINFGDLHMAQIIPWVIAFLGLLSGFVFNVLNNARARRSDIRNEAGVAFELKSLRERFSEQFAELKSEMLSMNRLVMEDHDKIIRHEEQLLTMWKRVDGMKGRAQDVAG